MQFDRLKRREFITLLGGAAAWPLAARGQQGERMRRIGVLSNLASDDQEGQTRNAAFLQGLQELGWTVGRNVRTDYRWGLGNAEFYRRQAADLVSLAPDVILTNGTSTIGPVLQTTRTVPIVFVNVTDPVAGGFVESLARPGGNATGFASAEYGMSGKWLELLKQIAPHVKLAAVIRNPRVASGSGQYGRIVYFDRAERYAMSPHYGKFIAYFRVSTDRQGKSGLGLRAQRETVMSYLDGGRWTLVDEFTEVESGKRADRPELEKALAACKKQKAKLVIAKLDRLSRNLAFIATLMESGVEFVAVDNPHANKLTVHILAAVAQHEREMISERTKAALAAAKKRGQVLGNPNLGEAAKLGTAAVKRNARRFAANIRPIIEEIMRAGATSHNAIAAKLNERNVKTARGGIWTHVQVGAILRPFEGGGANVALA